MYVPPIKTRHQPITLKLFFNGRRESGSCGPSRDPIVRQTFHEIGTVDRGEFQELDKIRLTDVQLMRPVKPAILESCISQDQDSLIKWNVGEQ